MKKLLSLILALTLVFALNVFSLAANTTGGDTSVKYTVATTFEVIIPTEVTITGVGAAAVSELTVYITNIEPGTCIKAAITETSDAANAFTVAHTTATDKTLAYTVRSSADGTTYAAYSLGSKVGACVADGAIYFEYTLGAIPADHPAGNYEGTVTFTIYNEAL